MKKCLGCMEDFEDGLTICPNCGYEEGTPAKESYHIVPGTVLMGRYIIGKVLGFGGFGVTYIGWDALLEKKVALKEYLPSEFSTRVPGQTEITIYSDDKEEQFLQGIDKFIEEAKKLAQFQSTPGIVGIYNSFKENNTAYIVMEYLEGETLKERITRDKKIPYKEAINIILPILTALKEVHKIGIIHRDIAPDNIYLTKEGEVKLLDFGAARFATTTHSKSLSVIIKPGYAPEEQYRSRGDQGPWTDVYSLGATLYKMITGVVPEEAMERAVKESLKEPSKIGVKIPKNVENAIMNALNVKLEDRTQTAEAFENELLTEAEVSRKTVKIKTEDVGRWPKWVKIVSFAGGGLVVAVLLLFVTGVINFSSTWDTVALGKGMSRVPNLVNTAYSNAEKTLEDAGFVVSILDKVNDDKIPENMIISQTVQGGKVVEEGTVIGIVLSAGEEKTYMIDVVGFAKEKAIEMLTSLGITDIQYKESFSSVAPGSVVKQSIEPNTEIFSADTVTLTVSKGYEELDETIDTTVPNIVGQDFDDAVKTVKTNKLYISKESTQYSDTVPAGQIISQTPTDGTVKQGTVISVIVSLGKKSVNIPDVQFKQYGIAQTTLEEAQVSG